MGLINKLVVKCGSISYPPYVINLVDTDDAGINAILGTIPSSRGIYIYSHTSNNGIVTSSLDVQGTCKASLFKDGVAYSTNGTCCITIDPATLISSDAGNSISTGSDGKLFSTPQIVDVYVNGGSLDANYNLVLVDNNGITPNVTIPLDSLRKTTAPIVVNGTTYPIGTPFQTILENLSTSTHPAATSPNTSNPALTINPTTQVISLDLTAAGSATPVPASATKEAIAGDDLPEQIGSIATILKAIKSIKQAWQKVGLTGTLTNADSVDEADLLFRTGKVSIGGITAPTSGTTPILKAFGSAEITENIYTPNTSINGAQGVLFKGGNRFLHNYGNRNTFLGENSGNLNNQGEYNTGLGTESLLRINLGYYNTAIGTQSLYFNTNEIGRAHV